MATKNKNLVLRNTLGLTFVFTGIILVVSFFSYLNNWQVDQSQLAGVFDKDVIAKNALGKLGAWLGELFVYHGIGVAAFLIAFFLLMLGARLLFTNLRVPLRSILWHTLIGILSVPLVLNLLFPENTVWQGVMGYEVGSFLKSFMAPLGMGIFLLVLLLIYLVVEWKITPEGVYNWFKSKFPNKIHLPSGDFQSETDEEIDASIAVVNGADDEEKESAKTLQEDESLPKESVKADPKKKKTPQSQLDQDKKNESDSLGNLSFQVTTPVAEEIIEEAEAEEEAVALKIEDTTVEKEVKSNDTLVEKFGEFDPTLELSGFRFPSLDLLKVYDNENNVTIDQKELESNKNRIVETLGNYGIKIAEIKATIGPTVTLYEIVPEAGVRISKIKNLEDDIALSLSALGIRIIAPIPGKGTIGIEVPNTHTSIVSMRSVLASKRFKEAEKMALPIAFGKTISNETFVADLAKMPHLLMAGATGQGKSVGLNAIIASLLYKKHPAELKFIFVDPKKVELTLYNKIERHYLAKLPDSDEAIITDNQKVINTLNSLCIEMDERYELLKNAYVRNIREYNEKFKNRKLNPENGHKFLPYIVLVIDEFADLIMTAGKEVEMPIARLAQLARAVGIHLIVATQRPSVNVITGIIKANFPARVAFRVTSKIDSRTILDFGGADQLIGKGDMLFTTGNDLVRLQCAFVDTPEVDRITEFIGGQKAYPSAFLLPEYAGEESGGVDVNLDERDALFEDAARILVNAQQGSASNLQRKLKIGYNRAGRLIDQLEAAGVVGPFEGSKARQVLIPDELSLEQLLDNLNGK